MGFEDDVLGVLRGLRRGDVVTYGEVAEEAGHPGAARAVGNLLRHSEEHDVPWWRVVTAAGRLVPGNEAEHARRLAGDGVALTDGRVRRGSRHRGAATTRSPTARSPRP